MSGPITILDIASELGLSKTTVGDALGGSGRVSDATRRRIVEYAASRGYVSNRAARSLRSGKHGALGVYVPPLVRELSFYMQFAFGAADRAGDDGLDLTLLASTGAERRSRSLHLDGAIVVDPVPGDPVCEQLFESGLPIVSVGVPVDDAAKDRPRFAVTRIAYEDVIPAFLDSWADGDDRPVAFVRPDEAFNVPWRRDISDAVASWSRDRGVPVTSYELPVAPTDSQLRATLTKLSQSPAERYLFASTMVAGRALTVLERTQQADAVQLATLSGDPGTELNNPRIAGMDLDARTFGADAVQLLRRLIASEKPMPERIFTAPQFRHTGPSSVDASPPEVTD